MNKLKNIPKFKNEDEEFEFWQKADSTEYFDYSKAKRGILFPNLKNIAENSKNLKQKKGKRRKFLTYFP